MLKIDKQQISLKENLKIHNGVGHLFFKHFCVWAHLTNPCERKMPDYFLKNNQSENK